MRWFPPTTKPQRMNRRHTILHSADIVDAVAVDAGSHLGIAGSQTLTVDAGLIQLELVDPLARRVLAHVVRIAVAARAELGNGGARRLAPETFGPVHGGVLIGGSAVASMAVRAT